MSKSSEQSSNSLAAGTARKAVRNNRHRIRDRATGLLLISPGLFLVLIIFIVPLCLSVWMSLSSWPLLGDHHFTGLANYEHILKDHVAQHALQFTLEFAAITASLVFFVGLGLATLVQHERRGVALFRTAIFAPVAIGFAAASYIWLALTEPSTGVFDRVLVDLHLTDQPVNWLLSPLLALVLVVIVTTWKIAGFAMVTLMIGLQSVPADVEDAAKVDGAGRIRMLWNIKLPLMRGSVAFTLTFVVSGALLSFDQLYILTSGGPANSTITTVYDIYNTAFIGFNLGYAAAISLTFLVIVLLIVSLLIFLLRPNDES